MALRAHKMNKEEQGGQGLWGGRQENEVVRERIDQP